MTLRGMLVVALALGFAGPVAAAPTRTSPLAVAPDVDGVVFVVNPDSDSVARLTFGVSPALIETKVGRYPRTVTLAGGFVYTADQKSDSVSRRAQSDLGGSEQVDLGAGCAPYGVVATPAGDRVLVSCQGTSELVVLSPALAVTGRVKLDWPNPRAIAVTADGGKAYVTHFLTEEPLPDAHVSVVDLAGPSVATVFVIPPDKTTCETQNSGQGPLNLVNTIAIVPAGPLAGQVWVGGIQENDFGKGLFERFPDFIGQKGAALFPRLDFTPFPPPAPSKTKKKKKHRQKPDLGATATRNKFKPSFHDVARFGIYKLDGNDGHVIGKIDIDEANQATDVEISADGHVAYVVDQMFNSYHLFNTAKGQDGDVTTLFASPSARGPGGSDPTKGCIAEALTSVDLRGEGPFRMAPQSQITTIDGYQPFDGSGLPVATGVDFDAATYMTTTPPVSKMHAVPDGVGTAPIAIRLSRDGQTAYVANYLARNVVPVAAAEPLDGTGKPMNLRCTTRPDLHCATNNDCPGGGLGFCNHPGGKTCSTADDCGQDGPCIRSNDCVPIILGDPQTSITGGIDADPLAPSLLDGKILFNTAARDSSVPNGFGLGSAAPPFNDPTLLNKVPGSVVSTAHDASYVACATCHADFGGQDGRTWDFSQFGASLRNTMDLRGRPSFAPGTCSNDAGMACTFDAACGAGNFCKMNPDLIPPNVSDADRDRYFNPMLTVHWNGDRDEVEDFEHTFRQLMGAGDCDGIEDINDPDPSDPVQRGGCMGALVQRSHFTSTDPVDVNSDLGAPNRNLRGKIDPSKVVGIRLTHLADFVYSLTEFPTNPNGPDAAAERGRQLFNDPQTKCAECHNGGPPGRQLFTDKRPVRRENFTPPAGPVENNPFVRHNVRTDNLFDRTDPKAVATETQSFQNQRADIPASRGTLAEYVTPILNDVWNTAPYLHDGTAPTLLDVIRPCDTALDECEIAGRGRNLDDQHGATSFLTPQQLNDLAHFQETLTAATVVGTADRGVSAGTLRLTRAVVRFGSDGAFAVSGVLGGATNPVDPSSGATLTLGVPAGGRMAFRSWTVPLERRGRRYSGKVDDGGGALSVRLASGRGGTLRLAATGRHLDLAALDRPNRDLTVAVEIAGTAFVKNRTLDGKKQVFRLRRKGGRR